VDGKPAIDLDAVRSLLAGDPGAQIALTYQRGEHQGQATLTLRTLI
jgi:S1-C subfamily serine protease